MTTLSVVIPALNEQEGIAAIVRRVLAIRPDLATSGVADLELIVVDDGSTDDTPQIVASFPEVRLLRHPQNRGYGAALKTGFAAARGELIGFLDADGTYPPELFPSLCTEALNGADLVVGSRRSGASSEMPVLRRVGNLLWSSLVSLLCTRRVLDPASGMRVFHAAAFEQLEPLPDGLNFTPVMSTRAISEGLGLVEIPIPYQERAGRSKLNVVKDGALFLRTILWTSLAYNPARILAGLGLLGCIVAAAIGIAVVIARLQGVTALGPLGVASLFVAVVAGIIGIDLMALGSTFNYLVSLFHRQPVRRCLFGRPLFKEPVDRHFWWMGGLLLLLGTGLAIMSLALGLNGWAIERLWLYLLAGVMLILVGAQLGLFWVIIRVLDELRERQLQIQANHGLAA
jgi:hypothetical protein